MCREVIRFVDFLYLTCKLDIFSHIIIRNVPINQYILLINNINCDPSIEIPRDI